MALFGALRLQTLEIQPLHSHGRRWGQGHGCPHPPLSLSAGRPFLIRTVCSRHRGSRLDDHPKEVLWGSQQIPPSNIWRRAVGGSSLSQFLLYLHPSSIPYILVIFCHVTNSPKLNSLKQQTFIISWFLRGSSARWSSKAGGGLRSPKGWGAADHQFSVVSAAVGRRPQFWARWAFCVHVLTTGRSAFLRASHPRGRPILRSDVLISVTFYSLNMSH